MSGSSTPGKIIPSQSKVMLFNDKEDKTAEARKTYVELQKCTYSQKGLGNTRKNEFMECDCYEEFKDGKNHACDEHSDCINRLTLIECVNDLCTSCGDDCQNQRFQKRQYEDISIFQTEKKGYGVRAEKDIEANTFIYEYIGEVISEDEFRDRMVSYDERGYKHFYFMMLQAGEFIDATEKGCLARFCNHSCNPNTYVSKWDVAGKLRMGIFAKRKIVKGEELTFDYNVDRYGATAQPCYCGEPNCIAFLGGKTQTDAASLLPQDYAEALSVTPAMEKKWVKMKKAMGQEIDKSSSNNVNVEFVNSLEPQACTQYSDVNKVMSVLLQTDDHFFCSKLLQRILLTTDETMHYQIIKLHGYKCFSKLLTVFDNEEATQYEILTYLLQLPKTTKNGIILSQLDTKIRKLANNPALKETANSLLERWDTFETYKRIAKKDLSKQGSNSIGKTFDFRRVRLPLGWEIIHENGRPMYYNAQRQLKQADPPTEANSAGSGRSSTPKSNGGYNERHSKRPLDQDSYEKRKRQRIEWEQQELEKRKQEELRQLKEKMEVEQKKQSELEQIIADANRQKEQQRLERLQKEKEAIEKREKRKQTLSVNRIEHEWNKYFASFVPNLIKSYESKLDRTRLKECAREIVKLLTTKELKKDSKKIPPSEVTKEKKKKVNEFCKGYMEKLMFKVQKKQTSK
ncbi:HDL388Cp [Eremothecium sinecaudum]|uniref:Histone-lysine N-methyltransferase, H3 lysine-36 specific n=1 Tax=Eremothecium sinecaudum TaxID=45286 RepID=A0A109UWV3_9SACH|nr:HDL388Cp [Eremothecium sinecaudum]AMD20356.1 HDL388Cp [Eremothecium sinecaudum]